MKLIKKIKLARGSVLVFSLIVLFIGVVAALGIASTTVISQKMAGTTGKSVGSFQVADSGAEIFLKAVKDAAGGDTLLKDLGLACNNSTGVITGNIGTGKNYNIIAYKLDGSTIANCSTAVSDIDKIKSTGTYASTSRAVEVAVAAGGEGITGGCNIDNTDLDQYRVRVKWGDGCKNNDTVVDMKGHPEYFCSKVNDSGYTCGSSGFFAGGGNVVYYFCLCIKQ